MVQYVSLVRDMPIIEKHNHPSLLDSPDGVFAINVADESVATVLPVLSHSTDLIRIGTSFALWNEEL